MQISKANRHSKRRRLITLWSLMLIPMSPKLWEPTALSMFGSHPQLEADQAEAWKITSKENAGGWGTLLSKALPWRSEDQWTAQWSWSVEQFPNSKPEFPLTKDQDDYALRVGYLVSGGKSQQIPTPATIKKKLKAAQLELSYLVFYVPVQKSQQKLVCGISPHHKHILLCQIPAGKEKSLVQVQPLEDLQRELMLSVGEMQSLKISGMWIVADSDNSQSASISTLAGLRILSAPRPEGQQLPAPGSGLAGGSDPEQGLPLNR